MSLAFTLRCRLGPLLPARFRRFLREMVMGNEQSEQPNDKMVMGNEQSEQPKGKFEVVKDTGVFGRGPDRAVEHFSQLGYHPNDFYDHFSCFTSAKNISRFVSFYECYKRTLGLAGHIAEVGVFRGAASFFFTKLALLYEPHGITQVHGFDWFKQPDGTEDEFSPATYYEPYERISQLVEVQGLRNHFFLHRMDVVTELEGFFRENPHFQFKIVFLDAGNYEIVSRCIKEFWPRLSEGGILIFDQYNFGVAPGETTAAKDFLPPDAVIRTFPNGWMPTAYVVKGERLGLSPTSKNL